MKQNKLRKRIRYLALILLLSSISMSTMAYYTASESIEKKFTHNQSLDSSNGGIKIELKDESWDTLEAELTAKALLNPLEKTKDQLSFKPGAKYPSSPNVTIMKDNIDTYVFMALDHNLYNIDQDPLASLIIDSVNWREVSTASVSPSLLAKSPAKKVYFFAGDLGVKIKSTKEYTYIKSSNEDVSLSPLFSEIVATDDFGSFEPNTEFKIDIQAFAHQATTEDYTKPNIEIKDLFIISLTQALAYFYPGE